MNEMIRGALILALGALLTGSALVEPVGSQTVATLVADCAQNNTSLEGWCREVSLAAQALQGGVGLALSGGSDLPGTGSTLGRRLGSTPRIAFTVRANGARVGLPSVLDGIRPEFSEESLTIPALHVGVSVGVLDGFSLTPAVGGILSLDLQASALWLFLPEGRGFHENRSGYGVGARIGVFRESFTFPGVSLSVVRRAAGAVRFGNVASEDWASLDVGMSVTSLRSVVSKSISTIALVGGIGLDRYTGDVDITALAPYPLTTRHASATDFESSRLVYFAGASMTFLVLQISAEAGWGGGYDDPPAGRTTTGYDPTSGDLFAGLAFRLTF